MFSQLFFVLLALTLITFIPETGITYWVKTPIHAFQWGMGGYLILLGLLYGQARYRAYLLKGRLQKFWWPIVNLEILFFLGLYHFGIGTQRFFQQSLLASYQTPFTLISLLLYFFAFGWTHLWSPYFQLQRSFKRSIVHAYHEILFFCPFCLPFIVITLCLDGLEHASFWKNQTESINQDILLWTTGFSILGLTLIFLPVCMILCWRCRSFERLDLKERLEQRCLSLDFRHAGFKIWSALPYTFTAGIIGIIPYFRYILFTPALLHRFKPEEIEAILVHEIGHNYYRHLLFYPFIMLGMLIAGALVLIGLDHLLSMTTEPFTQNTSYFVVFMGLFILYALIMGIYFRVIFGFFSRLFERQADLYIFASSLSPLYLIQALDRLGVVTGYTHSTPSWHHGSLQERIGFLHQAMNNPLLILQHHQRVKKWLIGYFLGLILACLTVYQLTQ